ncbi:hypothetical protein BFX14_17740 [Vibrio cholerae]|nr:hypothetical protein BFX14_17740 [Vibrio cholerae]
MQVEEKKLPSESVPVVKVVLPTLLVVLFHELPSADVPLVKVELPIFVLDWFQFEPVWLL